MRTTVDIDDDILQAAKELARAENKTAGKVLSELVRKGLTMGFQEEQAEFRGGFRMLPRTGQVLTPETVEKLLEEDP
jgi:hypothetical protein